MGRMDLPASERDDSRLRILLLYRMLWRETNEQNTLSTREIMKRMEAEHGILLKSDYHTLFDSGYVTFTKDCHMEVSRS